MLHRAKFDLDFSHGELGEHLVAELVRGNLVEVKRDRATWRTGNVAIEFRCRGRKSGIAATASGWWALVLDHQDGEPETVVLVRAERLRDLARDIYRVNGAVNGGDENASELVLVPAHLLVSAMLTRPRSGDGGAR